MIRQAIFPIAAVVGAVLAGTVVRQVATAQDSPSLAARFRQLDVDEDGRITPTELSDAALFERLDTNADGEILLKEARDAIAAGALQAPASPPPAKQPEAPEIRQGPKVLKGTDQGIGRQIPNLSFTDLAGKTWQLSDFADRQAVVIAMTGTGCPLCRKYAPSLAELEQRYREQDVAFVFVNPNASEKQERLQAEIKDRGFAGPYVRDPDDLISRRLSARTTTEVFVLDAARTLVYRGAVDDQYGFAYALEAPRNTYLADALDALLADQVPKITATTAPGCDLYFDDDAPALEAMPITYHNRVSRILQTNCLGCHRDGGLGPFPLTTYEQVKDYAGMIRRVVEQQTMPPWFAAPDDAQNDAEPAELHWANDRSMSAADKTDLLAWIAAGVPVGDPQDAPLSREFPTDWMIGTPDLTVQIPEPVAVAATGRMPYQYAQVKLDITEDRWVQAVEVRPTDPAVVHHVLVFVRTGGDGERGIDEEGGFFAAYVPGNSYQQYPDGFAKRLPAGSSLVFQLHYTPNGTAAVDQTELAVRFCDAPPRHLIRNTGISNHKIEIPAGAGHHPETAGLNVPQDVKLLALMPHMHLRGKAFRYELVSPDGERQTLLDVPRYDFNWQLEYRLANPLDLPRGSRLEVTGWYDNSEENPANPNPAETVRWGPQTEDEMLLGYVEYYVPGAPIDAPSRALPTVRERVADETVETLFNKADRNGDGKVTADELPRKRLFARLDTNADGVITLEEIQERRKQ